MGSGRLGRKGFWVREVGERSRREQEGGWDGERERPGAVFSRDADLCALFRLAIAR